MKKKPVLSLFVFLCFLLFPAFVLAAGPTYSVFPDSKTYEGDMMNYSTYNTYTKDYYVIRSYLEQLERDGGGTLLIHAGVYTISNTLYVPSHVTIKLKDGAVLKKGSVSGTSKFSASKSMFQLIRPTLSKQDGVYGSYNGEKNISIIGEGTAVIDMGFIENSLSIIAGHNSGVRIENIHFLNMHSGHFIELDASENVVIRNNHFLYSKASDKWNKEGINLDTPDHATNGWSQDWSTYDKTPNRNVLIEGNVFYDLDRAIGTHKYSHDRLHDGVTIRNNAIKKMRKDPIFLMNWRNAVIEGNQISDVGSSEDAYSGIIAAGALNPTIENNTFHRVYRPIYFFPWQNEGPGSEYEPISNILSSDNLNKLASNKVDGVTEDFARVYDGNTTDYYPSTVVTFKEDARLQNLYTPSYGGGGSMEAPLPSYSAGERTASLAGTISLYGDKKKSGVLSTLPSNEKVTVIARYGTLYRVKYYDLYGYMNKSQAVFPSMSGIGISIDGHALQMDEKPVIRNGRVLIPIRWVSNGMGIKVKSWNNTTKTATLTKNGKTISLTIGKPYAVVNGKRSSLDETVQLIDSRTYVPLRFVSEQTGAYVDWDSAYRMVWIEK
ncbi:right-handed parallel beta-helix repeat-containing protein (plasmid) [Pontibacillus sp. ALD_SL1]|uniref:stalk domain-containing protein n=1 Tax=Pontibacillus sp. ALD_SL1 TaxID=2777185 RepID=UPI001A965BA8|nr:stalk domain-containing protein [Pontibacillus sp. ALD_SL1]QST02494.1 right-handed parallel beta-helix repeat-containing protein [Pontibacillus sp. ALD_SL1]